MKRQLNIPAFLLATVLAMHGVTSVLSTSIYASPMHTKLQSFAFDLYRRHTEFMEIEANEDENLVFSPISIFSALSLVGRSTDNESRTQLKKALRVKQFRKVQSFVSDTFKKNDDFTLTMAQRVYVSSTLNITDGLFDEALIQKLDFHEDPDLCRLRINFWVAEHTMDQIAELLEEGQVSELTRLYIVNALALEASWHSKLDPASPGTFTTSSGEQIKTAMMRAMDMPCMFRVGRNEDELRDTTVLVLPFKGNKLTFIAVMPHRVGDFTEVNTPGGQQKLIGMMDQLWSRTYGHNRLMFHDCDVTIPKFNLDYDYMNLKDDLFDMGIKDVFDSGLADLSRLYKGDEALYVSDVAHKATFSLDENGVKATAATGIGISARSMPPRVKIDKPFLFFVRSQKKEAILFMGKVVNPALH